MNIVKTKNKIELLLKRLRFRKILLVVVLLLLIALAAVAIISFKSNKDNQTGFKCIEFERQTRELIGQGPDKTQELLEVYKNNYNYCDVKSLPTSDLSPKSRVELYRRVSISALSQGDSELSKEIAKRGLQAYENLTPEEKQRLENSLIIIDLQELEKGKY
ncbi:hypothetical protein KY385_03940 [Candidatus Parcubacteria bacterium]|nr:hypothetical protein [Candidatus Parcubacteria bacterium]